MGAPRGILVVDPSGGCGPLLVELPTDPNVHPKPHFKLVQNAELKKFLDSTYVLVPDARTHEKGAIRATFQGRFDVARPGRGFGHRQLYDLRVVLQEVSNVSATKNNSKLVPRH